MATQPFATTERAGLIASLAPDELKEFLGYEAMAADSERERQANEWVEGLIGDVG